MPFAALDRPALGLSLLKARLREEGIHCDVRYPAFRFADYVGLEDYYWLHGGLPYTAFAGDWTFTASLYGPDGDRDARYVQHVLRETWRLDQADVSRLLRARAYCEPFLEHCLDSVEWEAYDVVGFSSTFEQNIASLALARRLKERHAELVVVFGGANWEGEMGSELHAGFPFVDVVCCGEADQSFPELLRRLACRQSLSGLRGIVHRTGGRTVAEGPAPLVRDLDALPYPDFDDYFAALDDSPAAAAVTPTMMVETSRGCWWGAKHHCTFCGLNGGAMAFRSKHADRALAEIRHLAERHGAHLITVVDNILDMGYFRTLLPQLAEEDELELSLFYEVKANLSREQVGQLALAHIRQVQPGIESLSDHVLALMRKGTTALQNVQLLKWCREYGVTPLWNLLYGFPGETQADYEAMIPLVDRIDFLDPPGAHGPVRLDRFSPYHADAEELGLRNVRALAPYTYLYPFGEEALRRIAYYFDFEYADRRRPLSYAKPLLDRVQRWMDGGPRGGIWAADRPDGSLSILRDRPGSARESLVLEDWQAEAYRACDAAHSPRALLRNPALRSVPERSLLELLDWCTERGLMLHDRGRYLALAVHAPARPVSFERRERLAAAAG